MTDSIQEKLTTSDIIPDLDMVLIPGGTFLMGSNQGDSDEQPIHPVTVASFLMSKFVITQAQWRAVATLPRVERDLNPQPWSKLDRTYFIGDELPAVMVSWHDAKEFCARLSRITGHTYRLPSEAEWEYACRAGTTTKYNFGDETLNENVEEQANYADEEGQGLTPAGVFPPNAFGLYDMHGLVWEWCEDTWHDNYNDAPSDGTAWVDDKNKKFRLRRGGSWNQVAENCRSAVRNRYAPDTGNNNIGFRVVCSQQVDDAEPTSEL
jgi:formylglycine-generating enzyme required for sulfatase activity